MFCSIFGQLFKINFTPISCRQENYLKRSDVGDIVRGLTIEACQGVSIAEAFKVRDLPHHIVRNQFELPQFIYAEAKAASQ